MSKLLHNFSDNSTAQLADFTVSKDSIPSSLLVTIDATHAGYKNKNGFWYDSESMRYAVNNDVWTKPFPKPLLKNHNLDSEPLGRVQEARFIDTEDGKGFTQLDVLITDKEAIEKILDGRYLTVSTHGAPLKDSPVNFNFVECSICGTNLNIEDFCGHSRGRAYEDDNGNERLCYWRVGALDYKEVSIVNNPADNDGDTAAQITSMAMLDGETPEVADNKAAESNMLVFLDSEVSYADAAFLEITDVSSLIANKELWKAVGEDKQKYISSKGLIFTKDGTNSQELKEKPEETPLVTPTVKDFTTVPTWENDKVSITSSEKGGSSIEHTHTVMYEDDLGNGWTDHVLGHSHDVVDGKLKNAMVSNTDEVHTHSVEGEVDYVYSKKVLDHSDGHRHGVYVNAAGNGHSSWVEGHSHEVVDGNILSGLSKGKEEPHKHSLVDFNKEDNADMAGSFFSIKDVENYLNELNASDNLDEKQIKIKDQFEKIMESFHSNENRCIDYEIDLIIKSLELYS
ncbi:hypothetical protein H8D85_00585 [bacterium]|nr:hypothetical protein [bacterium]